MLEGGRSFMFCPKCKSEYRIDFTVCSDCNVKLVPELPADEEDSQYLEYEKIFSTNNPGDIALLKSILDAENITYYFQGEEATSSFGHAVPATLFVRNDEVAQASQVLKDLNFSLTFGGRNRIENDSEAVPIGRGELHGLDLPQPIPPPASSGMPSFILRYIDFRYCYYSLLGSLASMALYIISWLMRIIPHGALHVPQQLLAIFLNLYVYLGYIKYSYIEEEENFRRIMLIVIGLSIVESVFSLLPPSLHLSKVQSLIWSAVSVFISTPLLFYGFKLIKTAEAFYFGKLAKLNLYLLIIGTLWALLLIPELKLANLLVMTVLMLSFLVTVVSLWYWEIKLFRHLSRKFK
jgi:hypothetical protein